MIFARRALRWRVVVLCLTPWLALTLRPEAVGASQHMVRDLLTAGDIDLSQAILQDVLESQRSRQMRLWSNDATGVSGSVMPLKTFKIKTGHYCRNYRETLIAGGRMETRDATACRTKDGLWIPIEN